MGENVIMECKASHDLSADNIIRLANGKFMCKVCKSIVFDKEPINKGTDFYEGNLGDDEQEENNEQDEIEM